ncbi:2-succinyl-6-hydroxy-2,4-cyclohexadiene-1-carboxylate synthase [uncultured archaeon]|nr:2-succinyl-6-hydroxy-2,4-cyclohexadiene-1-carboxylate synthase [uncultured archaeon]
MKLFPSRKPYRKGYLAVGDGHELFYALYGNPKGSPVLFVHGGPGGGCGKHAYQYFNPKLFNILTIDQRGAGKSRPFSGMRANTTQKLVQDLHKFLKFLKIRKTFVFGGSWGSCLSLCYAIKYPETVLGMVLRGIYLGSRYENDYSLKGYGRTHFPEVWERFVSFVPKGRNPSKFYWKMMNSKNPKIARKYCYEWAMYEGNMLHLEYNPEKTAKDYRGRWFIPLARFEAKYLMNDCFLPKDYILKNCHKIQHIPCSIVHGRYDFVCTPEMAYVLHKNLPKSKLFFVTAGHAVSDPAVRDALMREIHLMRRKIK